MTPPRTAAGIPQSPDSEPGCDPLGLSISRHGWSRMSSRAITERQVDLTLRYGRRLRDRGVEIFLVGRRELERFAALVDLRECEGVHVLTSADGCVVTVYRNVAQIRRARYSVSQRHRRDRRLGVQSRKLRGFAGRIGA